MIMYELQDGIYYKDGQRPGNSYCVVFFDIQGNIDARAIGNELMELWGVYDDLKTDIAKRRPYKEGVGDPNDPSILIGYGSRIFSIPGILKQKPKDFSEKYYFSEVSRGNAIVEDTSLLYRAGLIENPLSSSCVVVQFISNDETITKLAWTRTWDFLKSYLKDHDNEGLYIRKFYSGYNRPDNRSWLGFYDGISNIRSSERNEVISINQTNLDPADLWTLNGTYLAFIRMSIDIEQWYKTEEQIQERIVGRDKETGCPIIGVKDGQNILLPGCPTYGTDNVTQYGNQTFRSTSSQYEKLYDPEIQPLKHSHMNRMIDGFANLDSNGEQSRIYRQGYDFLDPSDTFPFYSAGLNFVSFQDNPEKIHNLLRFGFNKLPHSDNKKLEFELSDFVTVESAGLFLVPPYSKENKFPGSMLFVT
jgi:Dyp-type peroxidase family